VNVEEVRVVLMEGVVEGVGRRARGRGMVKRRRLPR